MLPAVNTGPGRWASSEVQPTAAPGYTKGPFAMRYILLIVVRLQLLALRCFRPTMLERARVLRILEAAPDPSLWRVARLCIAAGCNAHQAGLRLEEAKEDLDQVRRAEKARIGNIALKAHAHQTALANQLIDNDTPLHDAIKILRNDHLAREAVNALFPDDTEEGLSHGIR
jgi:hypothetical protein